MRVLNFVQTDSKGETAERRLPHSVADAHVDVLNLAVAEAHNHVVVGVTLVRVQVLQQSII